MANRFSLNFLQVPLLWYTWHQAQRDKLLIIKGFLRLPKSPLLGTTSFLRKCRKSETLIRTCRSLSQASNTIPRYTRVAAPIFHFTPPVPTDTPIAADTHSSRERRRLSRTSNSSARDSNPSGCGIVPDTVYGCCAETRIRLQKLGTLLQCCGQGLYLHIGHPGTSVDQTHHFPQ